MYSVMKGDRYGDRILMRCGDKDEAVRYAEYCAAGIGATWRGGYWSNADGDDIWIQND